MTTKKLMMQTDTHLRCSGFASHTSRQQDAGKSPKHTRINNSSTDPSCQRFTDQTPHGKKTNRTAFLKNAKMHPAKGKND